MSATTNPHSAPRAWRRRRTRAVRWRRQVPEEIRNLDTLARPDYADLVTGPVTPGTGRSAQQWLRTMVHAMPAALRASVPLIQRALLGLRLDPRPSADRMIGWKIAARGNHWLRLEASSWFLTGHIVVRVEGEQLSFATFVRYDRPVAALIWPPVSLIHRQVALALVRSAARAPADP